MASKTTTTEQMVDVMLPRLEKEGTGDVDQTVNVTINGKKITFKRGEVAQIPVNAYLVMKESGRFPDLR